MSRSLLLNRTEINEGCLVARVSVSLRVGRRCWSRPAPRLMAMKAVVPENGLK